MIHKTFDCCINVSLKTSDKLLTEVEDIVDLP